MTRRQWILCVLLAMVLVATWRMGYEQGRNSWADCPWVGVEFGT